MSGRSALGIPSGVSDAEPAARTLKRYRPLLALGAVVIIIGAAWAAGLHEVASVEALRTRMEGAGALGVVIFLALFTLAALTGIPGMPFVLASMLSYAPLQAAVIAFVGALMFSSVGFGVARWAGGSYAASSTSNRIMRRLLANVETRPLLCVIGLRLVFFLGPVVAYGLALTKMPFRTYLVGTAIGILPLLTFLTFFLDLWLS
jgi:uncharacterized membrane protein YdjX (TVP38/TMEM64 family)